jgi:hypothetical protein
MTQVMVAYQKKVNHKRKTPDDWGLRFLFNNAFSSSDYTQGVPGGNVNIVGGHSISHSKQESVYAHASHSERFPW